MIYQYICLYFLKDDKIIRNTIKGTFKIIFFAGPVYALGSYYVNYKPKEEIAALYEKQFQKNLIRTSQVDVMGNIKEKKRINLFVENKDIDKRI